MSIARMLNEMESENDHETVGDSKKKIWNKLTGPSGVYYSPFMKNKHELKHFNTAKEMVEYIKGIDNTYEVLSDNLVEIYEKTTPQESPIELPNGVYFHEFSSASTPERLIPMEIRNDKYLEILDTLNDLDSTVDDFINNKALYEDSCSAYKLGVLLFGPPGCGKTSYLREFIRKREAIVIYMDAIPNRKFLEKLETSTKDRIKIVIFEEALALVEASDDIRDMLDFLDGSKSLTSTIYFLSTNYPESIPENIIINGRIDVFVKVEYPNEEARKKLINLYLKREATSQEILLTDKMPIVDIREMCFLHKKTNKSFVECAKMIDEKNKMLRKNFGKTREIKL